MIDPVETEPQGVLSDAGVSFIENIYQTLSDRGTRWDVLQMGFETHENYHACGPLPDFDQNDCSLLRQDGSYFLKCRGAQTTSNLGREENKNEVRCWHEANIRGEEYESLFMPIVAYDDKEFNWVVMPEMDDSASFQDEMQLEDQARKLGWDPDDGDAGRLDGELRFYDYGKFKRLDNDWISNPLE